jgi:hypothetical protein
MTPASRPRPKLLTRLTGLVVLRTPTELMSPRRAAGWPTRTRERKKTTPEWERTTSAWRARSTLVSASITKTELKTDLVTRQFPTASTLTASGRSMARTASA